MLETYEQIWEQDAQWLLGRNILAEIIRFLEGKAFLSTDEGGGVIGINLPYPMVHNEISGENDSIVLLIPETCRVTFWKRLQMILERRLEMIEPIYSKYLGSIIRPEMFRNIDLELIQIEREIANRGEPSLAEVAAEIFGIPYLAVGTIPPAFLSRSRKTTVFDSTRTQLKLGWSEINQPNEKCRYTHCTAETPFGEFIIDWKGWKDSPGYSICLNGDYLDTKYSLEDSKEYAEQWLKNKIFETLTQFGSQ